MPDKATPRQENAINAKGTVLVSAAAGSGKTFVLTERVISLVCDNERPCDIDRLLIVTFTKAATSEMKMRIEKRLSAECAAHPENKRLLRQKLLLPTASICTIDSLCADLVRENFHELSVSPNFRPTETESVSEQADEVMDELLREFYDSDPEAADRLLEALNSSYGDEALKAAIRRIYGFIVTLEDPDGWLDAVLRMYDTGEDFEKSVWARQAFDRASAAADACKRLLRNSLLNIKAMQRDGGGDPPAVERFVKASTENLRLLENLERECASGEWDKAKETAGGLSVVTFGTKSGESDVRDYAASVNASAKKLFEAIRSLFPDGGEETLRRIRLSGEYVGKLVELVMKFEKGLFERCVKDDLLTFDMTEHLALELLKGEHGAEIAARYDWVLVDEYQDVNQLQSSLFRLLSGGDKRLFAVGDVKQSIYGFRRADPDDFLRRSELYPHFDGFTYPSKIILDSNFRSRDGICDYVNFVFGRLMSKPVCGMDYSEDDKLTPCADFAPRAEADAEIHIVSAQADETGRCAEARYIAEHLKRLVESGFTVGQRGNERPVGYGDCAVLMRAVSPNIGKYLDEFARAGVPVSAEAGGFYATWEIMTVTGILRAVSNPADDIALTGCMMSPFGGFSADDLAGIRLLSKQNRRSLYADVLRAAEDGNEKCTEFTEKLRELRIRACSSSIQSILIGIYERSDILNAVRLMDDSERRRANLFKFLSIASEFQRSDSADLAAFLRMIDREYALAMAGDSRAESSSASPGGGDAVRIMSIHKSKGLQFPVCVLAECDSTFRYRDAGSTVVLNEKYGIGVKISSFKDGRRIEPLPAQAIRREIISRTMAENMRLLYVAMTRAEDKLICVCRDNDPRKSIAGTGHLIGMGADGVSTIDPVVVEQQNSFAKWLYITALLHPSAAVLREMCDNTVLAVGADDMKEINIVFANADFGDSPSLPVQTRPAEPDAELLTELKRRIEYVYPFEGLNAAASKASVSALAKSGGELEINETPAFLSGTGLTPAQRGTAMHKFMQFCRYKDAAASAEKEADRLFEYEFISEAERESLDLAAIGRFFESEVYRRIENSTEVMREQRFIIDLPVTRAYPGLDEKFSDEKIVVQGAADCVFAEDGGLVVLDFKTDRVKSADELAARYAPQLGLYAEAFSGIYGKPVKEKLLYSFALGRAVPV